MDDYHDDFIYRFHIGFYIYLSSLKCSMFSTLSVQIISFKCYVVTNNPTYPYPLISFVKLYHLSTRWTVNPNIFPLDESVRVKFGEWSPRVHGLIFDHLDIQLICLDYGLRLSNLSYEFTNLRADHDCQLRIIRVRAVQFCAVMYMGIKIKNTCYFSSDLKWNIIIRFIKLTRLRCTMDAKLNLFTMDNQVQDK